MTMVPKKIRMLIFCRERYPTGRVDVEVLFGRELVGKRHHEIDCVMQAETASIGTGPRAWHGRTVWVGRGHDGHSLFQKARRYLSGLVHDLVSLRRVSRVDYDAVQVRDKFLVGALALLVARLAGVRFFFWLSFPIPDSRIARVRQGTARFQALTLMHGLVSRWLLKSWILPFADHVFLQSDRMRVALCDETARRACTSVVPMGISDDEVDDPKSRVEKLSSDGGVVLAYLGTLDRDRHLDMLVRTLKLLRADGVPASLLFIGGGTNPIDERLLADVARSEDVLEYVEITGMLPRSEAHARLRDADICLSPIYPSPILQMGSPTKLVEYLAMGYPVVANWHPEQREILRQCRGGVCVPWGERFFARGVRHLLSLGPEARIAMGERGRQWAMENRSYSTIASRLEGVYLKALSTEENKLSA